MIRKSAIIFLTLCFIASAGLCVASYATAIKWKIGDPVLLFDRQSLVVSIDSGRMVVNWGRRDEWKSEDGRIIHCYFSFGEYVPPNNPIPGVRYGLQQIYITGRTSFRTAKPERATYVTRQGGINTNGMVFELPTLIPMQDRATRTELTIWIAMWLPIALFGIFPLFAFIYGPLRRHRRRKHNQCLRCGYSLTGLTEPRCPECGEEI